MAKKLSKCDLILKYVAPTSRRYCATYWIIWFKTRALDFSVSLCRRRRGTAGFDARAGSRVGEHISLGRWRLAHLPGRTVAMEAEMTRRQLSPACASALRMKCTWQRWAYEHAMWRRLSICLEQVALQVH
jgi:hypothetical protein